MARREVWVRSRLSSLFVLLKSLVGIESPVDFEDAAQDIIVELLESGDPDLLERLEGEDSARLKLRDSHRKYRRSNQRLNRGVEVGDLADQSALGHQEGNLFEQEKRDQAETDLAEVALIIAKMPKDRRESLKRSRWKKQSIRQISADLNINKETVQIRIQEAIKDLHEQLLIACVEGKAQDRIGRPISNALIHLRGMTVPLTRRMRTGAQGGFRFEKLVPSAYLLSGEHSQYVCSSQEIDVMIGINPRNLEFETHLAQSTIGVPNVF